MVHDGGCSGPIEISVVHGQASSGEAETAMMLLLSRGWSLRNVVLAGKEGIALPSLLMRL